MRLISCYVSSFGKLKGFSYDFNSKLNTIKEDNGFGKSTFTIFLKSMFYGLSGNGKRSIEENERSKYRPWNSSERFGGFVIFEKNGKQYKIERFFGQKESEDTAILYDLQTGKSFNDAFNIGKKVFEIDSEGFESTTFFSQKDVEIKSNESLTEKYNSINDIQGVGSLEDAIIRVKELAKKHKYSGDRGLIPDVKRQIFDNKREIEECAVSFERAKTLKGEILALENQLITVKKSINEISEKIQKSGEIKANNINKKRLEEILAEQNNLKNKLTEVSITLNNREVSNEEIKALETCYEDYVKIKKQLDNLAIEVQCSPKIEEKNIKIDLAIILPILLLCIGIALCFVNFFVGIALVGFSLCLGLIVFLLKRKTNKTKDNVSNNQNVLNEKRENLSQIKGEYEAKLNEFFSKFNIISLDFGVAIERLKRAQEIKNDIINRLNILQKEEKTLLSQLVEIGEQDYFNDNIDYNAQLNIANREYALKMDEIARKKSILSENENKADSLAELKNIETELQEKLENLTENLRILNLTVEFLQKAEENLKTKYREPLQKAFNKYFSLLEKNNRSALIDVDFNVTIEENGSQKNTQYYSKGYQNLFDICKRFALIDVLFVKEKPFIILDDPFYNLDDDKLNSSLELIKKLSEEYQILYFVCHESRRA